MIFQGVLGGLRVVLVKLDLAIVHACFAQAFFYLAALEAVVTSRWWLSTNCPRTQHETGASRLITLSLCLPLGDLPATGRRRGHAALRCRPRNPDLPLAYGKLLPPTNQQELAAVNTHRVFEMNLKPVTLEQIWLHFGHRIGACLVTLMILLVAATVFRKHRRERA